MKNRVDIQSQTDLRKITIDKVGVKNVRYPIIVEDRARGTQHTVADLDIYVQLPHDHRGTHMSRFLEVLNRFHQENFIPNLQEFLQATKLALKAEAAYTTIKFPYFMEKKAPVSGIASLQAYNCIFEASLDNNFQLIIGVEVPVTSLCPCSREISDFGAHNQRSIISLKVRFHDFIWLEELIEMVEDTASSQIYPLLKRVDEKFVTEQAYKNPAFVEDIVRELTLKLMQDNRITDFQVEAENLESIHSHNAYASVSRSKDETNG
ncbi:MAG: GTP cyclohydrolase I FolE2 [Candidatus Cloacimonetes bacterium]|nr:GTP cyclohydrolase I FolE2 [Candidatus Cloacimonadota bacterium]